MLLHGAGREVLEDLDGAFDRPRVLLVFQETARLLKAEDARLVRDVLSQRYEDEGEDKGVDVSGMRLDGCGWVGDAGGWV